MLIATFSLPHDAIALERTFRAVPAVELEAERIAAHSTEWTMPCLWITGADFEAVDVALQADPTVDEIVETYEFDEETYYQVDWSDAVVERIDSFVDRAGSILEAEADDDGWRIQIRFASRSQFDDFREYLRASGYAFELLALTQPGTPRQTAGHLTPDQRDALVAALNHGYYAVPRTITAVDLADRLGISQQALSERLRRGVANLVHSRLVTDAETAGE